MRLGATVTGRMDVDHGHGLSIPASALTASDASPAVWVVDPANPVRHAANPSKSCASIPAPWCCPAASSGGEIVVTAGVQALHPGQKVRLLGARS